MKASEPAESSSLIRLFSKVTRINNYFYLEQILAMSKRDMNHKMIESWNGLGWQGSLKGKGSLKIIQFQALCNEQGHLPLDQVPPSPIQPGFGHFTSLPLGIGQ